MDIRMEPFSTQFDEVVIRAGKFEKKLEDQTSSIEVMKPHIIDAKNTRSVETILDMAPGVTILDSEPQIRGGSGFTFGVGSKVAVFIDDLPMITGDAGKPDWALVPVENIKQIEIVKGASSVLSGSSALSGAIYIRTNYPTTKPITKVRVYGGGYTTPLSPAVKWWKGVNYLGGASFMHARQLGDGHTDFVIGAILMTDRSYIGAPIPDPYVINTGDSVSDADMVNRRGRLNFNLRRRSKKITGLNFGLNGNFMYKKQSSPLAWLNDTSYFYRGYPGAVLISNTFTMYLDPFVNWYSGNGIKQSFTNRILYTNSDAINDQSTRALMIFNQYQFNKSLINSGAFKWDIVFGASSNYTKSHANMYESSGSADNWLWNFSPFVETELKLGNVVNLSLGLRGEQFILNDTIREIVPIFRIGASFKLGQETYLRGSYGQGYRFPTITERYIRTKVGSFGVFDNPDLISEHSWNAEVGLKQGFKFFKFFGYVDIAFFYQEYENTIQYLFGFWDITFAPAGFKFVNTGKSKVSGIDISYTGMAKFGDDFEINTMFGYTYVLPIAQEPDFVFAEDDRGVKYSYNSTSVDPSKKILKYRFLHTVKLDFEFKYKSFSYGFSMKYFSPIENLDQAIFDFEDATTSNELLQNILYRNYFYNHNNGSLVFDMRVSYEFLIHHKIALLSDNIFNTFYSLRPLKAEPMRSVTLQYSLDL
jgi:iron complex outermembrane receptor protein